MKLTPQQRAIRSALDDFTAELAVILHDYGEIGKETTTARPSETIPQVKTILTTTCKKRRQVENFVLRSRSDMTRAQIGVGVLLVRLLRTVAEVMSANLAMLDIRGRDKVDPWTEVRFEKEVEKFRDRLRKKEELQDKLREQRKQMSEE